VPERADALGEQIMGQWTGRFHPLLRERDRAGFGRADPDRQVALTRHLPEQHDRLARGHLHPDSDHVDFTHNARLLRTR
jgi:hypothetical protein